MSDERITNVESRMDRLEATLSSAGDLLLQASTLAEQNAANIGTISRRQDDIADSQASIFRGLADITTVLRGLANRVDDLAQRMNDLTQRMNDLTQRIDSLTQRVDSLTAASERHDRILDYLLRREADGQQPS